MAGAQSQAERELELEELRRRVVPLLKPYARRIAVFGSVARGEAGPQSDIDILVDLKPADERPPLGLRWFELEEKLSQALGRRVELISARALSPYLRPYVEKEMIVLYEERRRVPPSHP